MAISVVHSTTGTTSGTGPLTLTITVPSTTSGNTLLVMISMSATGTNPTVGSVHIGGVAGNFISRATLAGTEGNLAAWEDFNCTGAQTSLTITTTGGSGTLFINAGYWEVSGLVPTGAFDKTANSGNATTSLSWSSTATATLSQATEIAVGIVSVNIADTITGPGGSWVNLTQIAGASNNNSLVGSDIVAATTGLAYNGTFSLTSPYNAMIATFEGALAATVALTTPNISLAAPLVTPGVTVVPLATWSSGHARIPTAYVADAPPLTPIAVPVTNTAGQWLFAVMSWRQDAGVAGTLLYPSTVSVSDDAANFWIPVYSGVPAVTSTATTYATPAIVQSKTGTVVGTSLTITLNNPTTAGNCLVACIVASATSTSPTITNVTLGGGADHFNADVPSLGGVAFNPGAIWSDPNCAGGQTSVAITTTGGVGTIDVTAAVYEVSGLAASPFDKTANNGGVGATSGSWSSGATTALSQANEIAFGLDVGAATGITLTGPVSPWTNLAQAGPSTCALMTGYQAVSSTAALTYAGTASPNSGSTAIIATYKAATTTAPATGIVRCAIWMAPAARQAEFVFVSPTAYQAALAIQIFEFGGACPWYQVEVVTGGFTNQGGSLSAMTVTPGSSVFALGVVAYDNVLAGVTIGATGWSALATQTITNGQDHTGDIFQAPYAIVGTGSAVSLSVTGSFTMDLAGVIIVVSGVTDVRAYPYGAPALENWPVLVTEIGAGPTLNLDPVFAQGATFWTTSSANCTVTATTAVQWQPIPDAYQPALYGSVLVTPAGNSTLPQLQSNLAPISSVSIPYSALAWVYSPTGFGNATRNTGLSAGIGWYTSGSVFISSSFAPAYTVVLAGEWTQLTVGPVFPPVNAAYGTVIVAENGGTVNVSPLAVFYTAYADFGPADAYEGAPPDEVAWTDISGRVFTQGQIQVTRGIQYEQQTLEAGTLAFYVDNHDGLFTFGNVLSLFYPNIGDTDVPVRVRAIWAGSITPYVVLFSGFTDDIVYGVDGGTYYGYAQIQASDSWSRLTQQMLAVVENEALYDNPVAFISCNQTGGNTISTGTYNTGVSSLLSSIDQDMLVTAPSATFGGGAISVLGASGLSCWQSSGTKAATANGDGNIGYALVWPLPVPLPVTSGVTVEFWYCPVSDSTTQSTDNVLICGALATAGYALAWVITAQNATPANSFVNYFNIQTFSTTGATVSNQAIGTAITPFLTATTAAENYYFVVSWTTSSITISINPGAGILGETITLTGQNFINSCGGFWWGGGLNVHSNYGDTAIADIAIYDFAVPPARSTVHYQAGLTAFGSESDNVRLARIAGYSGFVPVLGMRGIDLPVPPAADVDLITAATDTNTQVVSSYFSNIAQSTLAAMFVNGPGTLIYRRRNEWYNRPIGQWVLGESDNQQLSLSITALNASASTAGWTTGNSAVLSPSVVNAPFAGGPLFVPYAGLFAGNGSTANPFIITTSNPAVTPGAFYQFTVWLYSAQGWTTGGVNAQIQFFNASNVQVGSTTSSPVVNIAAGSVAYAATAAVRAPSAAAYVKAVVQVNGTPSSATGFYVANAVVAQVNPDYAPGANVAVPEAPYAPDYQLGSDRAQLYNYAILTQYGQNLVSSFSGTSVLFTPSSGVIVLVSNVPSITQRGQVPYTATIYENNTAQATPYYLNEGSIEDAGSWVVETLGNPLFRPDKVTLTPAATPGATLTGTFAEVGDTVVFRRRPLGSPQVQIITYISKLTHSVDISTGTWTVAYELSPFPGGEILTADDVVHGVLTGLQQLGW